MREAPVLARFKEQYGDRVVFLSLTVEPQDTPEKIADKLAAPGLKYGRASDPAWAKLVAMGGEEQVLPTSVFVAANGDVMAGISGDHGMEDAIKLILP